MGWGVAGVVVAAGVVAGFVGEVTAGVAVVAGVVVGLAGCAGLGVTVTAGGLVGFVACGVSLDTGFGVVVGAAGVAAGVTGLAGMGVTVAGMGTAAGTGLVGEEAACACTGLGWLPASKEVWGGFAGVGVIDTEGVGGFGSVVAFWVSGDLGSCEGCCCWVVTAGLRGCWLWFCSCWTGTLGLGGC